MADSPLQLFPNALVATTGDCIPCVVGTKSGSDSTAKAAFNTRIRTNVTNGLGPWLVVAVTAGWN